MKQVLIKYTGSKNKLSSKIIEKFPLEINTYWEPFCGGASVAFNLMKTKHKVEKYVLSDINKPLIEFFELVKSFPEKIKEHYKENQLQLISDKKHYYTVRDRFNSNNNPEDFYFLTRTCFNGMIRYNSKNEFNTPFHIGRMGVKWETNNEIIDEYSSLLNQNNVQFNCGSYDKLVNPKLGDVVFLDPPYIHGKDLYLNQLNIEEFTDFLSKTDNWFLTFNGVNKSDNEIDLTIPYREKIYLESGNSSFSRLKNKTQKVKEIFYIK